MNNTHRENGKMAGPLIFTVPANGFVMALYLDWLRRTPTRERFPLTCVEHTRELRSGFGWPTHRWDPQTPFEFEQSREPTLLPLWRTGRRRISPDAKQGRLSFIGEVWLRSVSCYFLLSLCSFLRMPSRVISNSPHCCKVKPVERIRADTPRCRNDHIWIAS